MSFEIPDLFTKHYIHGNHYRFGKSVTKEEAIKEIRAQVKIRITKLERAVTLGDRLRLEKKKAGKIKYYKKVRKGFKPAFFQPYQYNFNKKPRWNGFSLSSYNYWKLWVIFKEIGKVFISHKNTIKMVTDIDVSKKRPIKLIDMNGKSSSVYLKSIECLIPINSLDELKTEKDMWVKEPGIVNISDVFGNKTDIGQHILYHNSGTFFYFGKIVAIQEDKDLGTRIRISIAKSGSKRRKKKFHTFFLKRGVFVAFDEDEAFKRLLIV